MHVLPLDYRESEIVVSTLVQSPGGVGELSARYVWNVQEFSDQGDPEHHREESQGKTRREDRTVPGAEV